MSQISLLPNDFMATCVDLLENGFISSYITLFSFRDSVPLDKLTPLLRDLETSQRKENKQNIYNNYKALAFLFLNDTGLLDQAIHYFDQALETVKGSDSSLEMEATRNVGDALLQKGDHLKALEYYETSLQRAFELGNITGENLAKKSLFKVHNLLADACEAEEKYKEAIVHHKKCLEYYSATAEPNDVQYRLGIAHQNAGDLNAAIESLNVYLDSVRLSKDRGKEGWAQCALASCYEKQGDYGLASNVLESFISASIDDPTSTTTASAACNQLGSLYNRMQKFDLAVHYFEKHFKLQQSQGKDAQGGSQSQTTGSVASEVELAISRGNAKASAFFDSVVDPSKLPSLLKWKQERVFYFDTIAAASE